MFSWVQSIPSFLVRNRNRVALASIVAVVVAICLSYYQFNPLPRLLNQAEETSEGGATSTEGQRSSKVAVNDWGRRGHQRARLLLRVRRQFDLACKHFLPTLRKKIFEFIDINATVRQIKELRMNGINGSTNTTLSSGGAAGNNNQQSTNTVADAEAILWDDVKVSAFTMHFVTIYMLAAVCVLLKIQLHILARSIALSNSTDTSTGSTSNAGSAAEDDALNMDNEMFRELIDGTYRQLFGNGLRTFTAMVKERVKQDLQPWVVKDKVRIDYDEVVTAMRMIRKHLEMDFTGLIKTIFIPPEADSKTYYANNIVPPHSPMVQKLLNQTWDILETSTFEVVYTEALDYCFRISFDHLSRYVFNPEPHSPGHDMASRAPPLASLLPQLKSLASRLLPDSKETAITSDVKVVSSGPLLDSLCISIFDAEEHSSR